MKSKILSQDGFISVVALGIFALLAVFGVIIQTTLIDSVQSVRATNNYYAARDNAEAMVEYLRFQVKEHEAGYNKSVTCEYDIQGGLLEGDEQFCPTGDLAQPNSTVSLEIKGRPDLSTERFAVDCPGDLNGCYVVPHPGTGDAGERCMQYQAQPPAFAENNPQTQLVDPSIIGTDTIQVHQIDYSCNWGRLTFGSSLTDRIAVPLYFEAEEDDIVNPYKDLLANEFILRVRTPCLPCVYDPEQVISGINRDCSQTPAIDPTVCRDDQRYRLDAGNFTREQNQVVVQWQLTGLCGDNQESCGMTAHLDYTDQGRQGQRFSGISELNLNIARENTLLTELSASADINGEIADPKILAEPNPYLRLIDYPILTLFLSEALISEAGKNVPYLEYQFLSDYPVTDSKNKIFATVNQDGNIFTKELTIDQQKDLIDFAIQN